MKRALHLHRQIAKLVLLTFCSPSGAKTFGSVKTCPRASLLISCLRGVTLAEWRRQLCNATAQAVQARDLQPFFTSTKKRQHHPMYLQGPLRNLHLRVRKFLWGTWFLWANLSPTCAKGCVQITTSQLWSLQGLLSRLAPLPWRGKMLSKHAHMRAARGTAPANPPCPLPLPALPGGVQAHPPQQNRCSHVLPGAPWQPGPHTTPFGKYSSKFLSITR